MMSRRRPRSPPRKAARRSTRVGRLQPVCDRSWSKTRIRWRASAMSSSIAWICSATVASSTLRGTGASSAVASADMEKTIAVPAIKPWPCTVADLARAETAQIGDALERGAAPGRPGIRLAVDEKVTLVVEKLRAPVQAQAMPRRAVDEALRAENVCGCAERDGGLGLGQVRAEELRCRPFVPGEPTQRGRRVRPQVAVDARRVLQRLASRIGVVAAERDAVAQPVEERGCELLRRGRTETDRIGAAGVERNAVVGDRRRQVEHVTRLEHPVAVGPKAGENLKRQVRLEREIALPGNSPTAPARALEQEDIVGVDVRADTAARSGVADEQVVKARVRQEGKATQQRVGGGQMQIDALYEQRPVALRQRAQIGVPEWAVRERPASALAQHQARFDVVARRQRKQFARRQQAAKAGNCLSHQERPLL